MGWMFMFPQNSYVEILTFHMMVLEGEPFRQWMEHESGAPMNGIGVLL